MTYQQIQTLSHQKTKFNYLKWGSGEQAIVMLHGFPETPEIWESTFQHLDPHTFTVYAPYLPGYSDHDKNQKSMTPFELGVWVNLFTETISNQEKIDKKICLVAHDFGAVAAYMATALNPGLYNFYLALSIPPIATYLKGFVKQPLLSFRRRYMLKFILPLGISELWMKRNNYQALRHINLVWAEGRKNSSEFFSTNLPYHKLPNLNGPFSLYKGLFPSARNLGNWRKTLRTAFKKISVPTYIAVGKNETTYPADVFQGFWQAFTSDVDVSFNVINDCGHFIPLDRPDFIAKVINDYHFKSGVSNPTLKLANS